MTRYRIKYTEIKPGGHHERQDDMIMGTLATVRDYIDAHQVYAIDPVVIIEQSGKSDGYGREVPASEWDVIEED